MAELPRNPDLAGVPEAHAKPKSRWTFQVVWLIPIVSALIGAWIAVKAVMDRGPVVTIIFQNAEGLEAGKTKLKYKDVEIGLVKNVALTQDLKRVVATAELVKEVSPHLVEDTRFWVVRPRISGGTVSGLGTLLSGSYIGVDTGKSKKAQREFEGLETPPIVTVDTPGREFILSSDQMASVDTGSPVFFRRLRAGQVTSYALNPDGRGVTLKVFVNEPYDKYVVSNTRFWSASGIDMKIDANGVSVETESLISILLGGIAFETPGESGTLVPVGTEQKFTLFQSRADAMKNPDSDVMKIVMVFNESARGLAVGAPVDFRGIVVGEVAAIQVDLDPKTKRVLVPVEINLYPTRMIRASRRNPNQVYNRERAQHALSEMVAHGLRGQMRAGSLITGQLYVALDFFPHSSKSKVNWTSGDLAELPTTPGTKQEIQEAISSVTTKLEKLPLEEIGKDVRTALSSADRLMKRVDADVAPDLKQTLQSGTKLLQRLDSEVSVEARTTLIEARKALTSADRLLAADAPLQHETRQAMHEIARAAYAFRVLADYLERNPQALLLGKKGDGP